MKKITFIRSFLVASLFLLMQPSLVFSASFTKGNLVVTRASAVAGTWSSTVYLDEYSTSGTLAQTVTMPTAVSGANQPFGIAGYAINSGALNLSTDKRFLVLGGNLTSAQTTRVIARVDNTAAINTSTSYTAALASPVRSVASTNGTDLWITDAPGISYTTLGNVTSLTTLSTFSGPYNLGIYDNKLYYCNETPTGQFGYESNGLPTTGTTQPYTVLGSSTAPTNIGLAVPYGMIMFDMDASIPGVDVMYVAESRMISSPAADNASKGLVKYCLNSSGVWVKKGAVAHADGIKQVTGVCNPASGVITLYAVTQAVSAATSIFNGTVPTSIVTLTDNSGFNNTMTGTFSTLATSAATYAFRGIAFAPQAGAAATVPDAPVSVAATAGNTQASVAFSTPNDNGGSAITGYTVTAYDGSNALIATVTGNSSPILVSGLTNGTAYTFTVYATNSIGAGTVSTASAAVTPLQVPDAPIIGAATVTAGSTVKVAFTAPTSDGGSAILSYTVSSIPRGGTGTLTQAGSGTITVTGLNSGTAYTFTVKATNANGSSIASGVSNSVTPYTVPAAISGTQVTPTAGPLQASVAFTPPIQSTDPGVTSYIIIAYNSTDVVNEIKRVSGTSSPIVVTGLLSTISYVFKALATNPAGTSALSTKSAAITPTAAAVPGSPTAVVATAGNAQASVAFTTPAANGSAITGYTVTPYIAGVAQTPLITTGTSSPIVVTSLTNGTVYTFTVFATNGVGNGAPSTASTAVTPSGTTAVNEVSGKSALSVSAYNGKIKFTAVQGEKLEVYTALGQKLLSKVTVSGVNEITLASKGVMIVKVGNRIAKVTL